MVEFHSTVAGLEAAIEIKRAMQDHDADLPEADRIRLRVGINLGEAIIGRLSLAERDRARAVEAMSAVGFPTCAKPEDVAELGRSPRLFGCEAARRDAPPARQVRAQSCARLFTS